MKLIKPAYIIEPIDGKMILLKLEKAARVCYKSEEKITEGSEEEIIKFIIKRGHTSVLEHEKVSVRIICDRGVSHELVRHRIASFSQESTRYCNYSSDHIKFIIPCWTDILPGEYYYDQDYIATHSANRLDEKEYTWFRSMLKSEIDYKKLIKLGWSPQRARSILPNSLKTEIIITLNLRSWRNFFSLRCDKSAHPQMREIAIPMLKDFRKLIPVIFDDIILKGD